MIPTQKFILENLEEMLGAYMEGNLSEAEETEVDKLLSENPDMTELLEDACRDIIFTDDYVSEMDVVSQEEIDLLQSYELDIDKLLKEEYPMEDINMFSYAGETAGSVGETAGSTATIKGEQATGPMQVGEAPIDEYSAYVKQGYSDTCAVNSQKIILDAFGKHYTEEQLREQAIKHGLYREGYGTSLDDMGKLLTINDCPCTNYIGGNVADLTKVLAEGKMVMMAVDSGELWKEGWLGKLWEKVEDFMPGIGGADHALLVTGIDASDPENVKVIVTDPGSGDLNKPYPIEQFIDAAKDSHFFMTVTDNPKPDVFNAYERPDMTHLPTIGGLNYHEFINTYTPYFTLGNESEIEIPKGTFDKLVASVLGEDYTEIEEKENKDRNDNIEEDNNNRNDDVEEEDNEINDDIEEMEDNEINDDIEEEEEDQKYNHDEDDPSEQDDEDDREDEDTSDCD